MHPFSTHTVPGSHLPPPGERGTQAPATQTSLELAQSFVMAQGCVATVHVCTVLHL
jgi:hypothetical protein